MTLSDQLISWELYSACEKFVDFNFVSSNEELAKCAEEKKCRFNSYSRNPSVRGCNNTYGHATVKTCNITGTWTVYDKDIEWACLNYDNGNLFHTFKNVFCYICNPPLEKESSIESCNVTGKWENKDNVLEEACTNQNKTPTTLPYKNIYCYFCNVEATTRNFTSYYDASVVIIENVTDDKYFNYTFQINNFFNDFFFELFNEQNKTLNYPFTQPRMSVNLTRIYEYYYALTGNGHFCHSIFDNLSTKDQGYCYCSDNCLFEYDYPCCVDAAFKYSTTCVDVSDEMYVMNEDCRDIVDGYDLVSHNCLNSFSTDVFNFLPVYDINTLEDYKNIYCGLCRTLRNTGQNKIIPSITHFKAWPFTITCKTFLPFQYQLYMKDVYQLALESECNIVRTTVSTCHGRKCQEKSSCENDNSDLAWACKNFYAVPRAMNYYYKLNASSISQYDNVFCALCDSSNITGSPVGYCNVTGQWDVYDNEIKSKCEQLPTVDFHWPYKNIFCKMCNEKQIHYENNYYKYYYCYEQDDFDVLVGPLRTIFSLSRFNDDTSNSVSRNCLQNQIYDPITETCRDIVCYPGRILRNGNCEPLMKKTSNLGYILSFGADLYHNFTIQYPRFFLNSLRHGIMDELEKYIDITYPYLSTDYIIIKSNLTCFNYGLSEVWNEPTSYVSVFIRIFISDYTDRDIVEKKLLLFQEENVTMQLQVTMKTHFSVTARFRSDEQSFLLPMLIHQDKSDQLCVSSESSYSDSGYKAANFIHTRVNSFLLCKQIELDATNFIISDDHLTLRLPAYKTVVNFSQFYLYKLKTVRMCVGTFKQLLITSESDDDDGILPMVRLIVTLISLLALWSTFFTYCFFKELRTLPGQNNMSLVISVFVAMVLLQYGLDKTKTEKLCVVLGVLIHYFWLCVFFCLNTCSFHVYYTFHNKTGYHSNDQWKRLMLYLMYSYGTPALIIVLNIILSLNFTSTYGYGGNVCFISERLSTILAFIVPVIVICFTNLFFYAGTAVTIAKTPKIKTDDTFKRNEIHFGIYVKLFVLTGCSWIMQMIDSFLPTSTFTVIVSIMNSVQGIYIFVAYICNSRVYMLYNNLFAQKRQLWRGMSNSTETGKLSPAKGDVTESSNDTVQGKSAEFRHAIQDDNIVFATSL